MFILWDILSQRKKKLKLTHPQPMVAVATFDIFNSVGWTFPALPIPRYYDEYGDSASIYGARGNASTCTAQGLFIQLYVCVTSSQSLDAHIRSQPTC